MVYARHGADMIDAYMFDICQNNYVTEEARDGA